jgi:nicotinate-nucleotide--dimethylbenzimidazole phosphoribosyltransferase
MARLTHRPVGQCVGHGAGLDEAGLERKRRVLEATLAHHGHAQEPLAVLATLGGFEIAMLVGALLQGAHERRVLVIDGFIVTVALLVAHALAPSVLDYCVFSHRSEEPGHAPLLARLEAEPLMNLSMRLGEGSGAAVAWPLVESAARLLSDMASFEQVGVSRCVP